jgi:hypothetical protein
MSANASLHIGIQQIDGIERGVEAVQRAFRVAGGARGEAHAANLVRIHVHSVRGGDGRRRGAAGVKIVHALDGATEDGIVDVQQDVRAIIRFRTIAQHRSLNLVEINGGGTAAQFRSTAIFQRRHRTLLKEV